MQAISPRPRSGSGPFRKLGYFFIPSLIALALAALLLGSALTLYRSNHNGRIYTGVFVQGHDIGGMTPAEASAALRDASPYSFSGSLTLVDPETDKSWSFTPAELGRRAALCPCSA